MPNETDTADAASGIGNLAFYRMCEEFPLHNDQDEVSDKLVFISRVYSVARGLGGEWKALAKEIVQNGVKLDEKIAISRSKPFLHNIDAVTKCHSYLNELTCRVLSNAGQPANNRASFASKYLHFHAPDAFPIMDALACSGLRKRTQGFRTSLEEPTPYVRFCERLAHHVREKRLEAISLRHIDKQLVAVGREIGLADQGV
jgi:hypothetical protein